MKNFNKGFIVPLLLAVAVLVIGGVYVYLHREHTMSQPTPTAPTSSAADSQFTGTLLSYDIINSVYIKDSSTLLFTDSNEKTWTVNYQSATYKGFSRSTSNGAADTNIKDWLATQKHVGDPPTVLDINGLPPGYIEITGTMDADGTIVASSIQESTE